MVRGQRGRDPADFRPGRARLPRSAARRGPENSRRRLGDDVRLGRGFHLGLGRVVYVYDDNHVSIDGPTELALSDDAGKRFEAYGWHTVAVEDGTDLEGIAAALDEAATDPRPSLIKVRTDKGKYTDFSDYLNKVDITACNKGAVQFGHRSTGNGYGIKL